MFNIMELYNNEKYKRGQPTTSCKMICIIFENRDELNNQELLITILKKDS